MQITIIPKKREERLGRDFEVRARVVLQLLNSNIKSQVRSGMALLIQNYLTTANRNIL
jgi:hypothetical protein